MTKKHQNHKEIQAIYTKLSGHPSNLLFFLHHILILEFKFQIFKTFAPGTTNILDGRTHARAPSPRHSQKQASRKGTVSSVTTRENTRESNTTTTTKSYTEPKRKFDLSRSSYAKKDSKRARSNTQSGINSKDIANLAGRILSVDPKKAEADERSKRRRTSHSTPVITTPRAGAGPNLLKKRGKPEWSERYLHPAGLENREKTSRDFRNKIKQGFSDGDLWSSNSHKHKKGEEGVYRVNREGIKLHDDESVKQMSTLEKAVLDSEMLSEDDEDYIYEVEENLKKS